MKDQISQHVRELYGEAGAAGVLLRLRTMLDEHRAQSSRKTPAGRDSLPLSQRDALLITYADQLRNTGESPLQTLAGFCERHLKGCISGVHLLPFYPWSSDDGFSVKDFLSVDPACGTWQDVARLGAGFDLMFDAVFNHVSVQGEWFQKFLGDDPRYRDFFISVEGSPDLSRVVRPRALPLLTEFQAATGPKKVWTTFSADQADLNFRNPDVLLTVVAVLLFYVGHGARFIRLDAIAFLWKEPGTGCLHLPQTHAVIRLLRAVLDEVAPHVLLITETNVPHTDNISYFGDGSNEAQLVYNFALPPLVLHSFATGNAGKLTRWAQSLKLPSDRVAFFNFLASHDGIGLNPARGILDDAEIRALEQRALDHGGFISHKDMPDGSRQAYELNINYLDALSNPAGDEPVEMAARKFLTAHAILLSLQGVPGIYFHSMSGSRGDRRGADTSGIPRRINREKLNCSSLELEIDTPHSLRSRVWNGLMRLLQIRGKHGAFHPLAAQRAVVMDGCLFALLRTSVDGDEQVLCLHNVSARPVSVAGSFDEAAPGSVWTDLLSGLRLTSDGSGGLHAELDAYQTLWLHQRREERRRRSEGKGMNGRGMKTKQNQFNHGWTQMDTDARDLEFPVP